MRGADAVFAAGDITSLPIKQGGIAAQQAVAAAEAIAVLAGASLVPHPFRPVLRGLLLTGNEPQYLRRDLAGDEPEWASASPIWWPPTKIVGRRLAPFLASLTGEAPVSDVTPPSGGLSVELPLDAGRLERFATSAPDVSLTPSPDGAGPRSVVNVMRRDPLLVTAATALDDVVRTMRRA